MRPVALILWFLLLVSGCAVPEPTQLVHFALNGAHAILSCSDCHSETLYEAVPTTCTGCHLPDRPIPHEDGECSECHDEVDWGNRVVDHSFFPLQGGHDGVPCLDCHPTEDYAAADPTCASCHETDRPAGHFTGACAECHPVTTWADGLFEHDDFFPTPHRGVTACESCHTTGDNGVFECVQCHEHRQSEADDEHQEVDGYEWLSPRCIYCHPTGVQ